jgi:hypothetical protein
MAFTDSRNRPKGLVLHMQFREFYTCSSVGYNSSTFQVTAKEHMVALLPADLLFAQGLAQECISTIWTLKAIPETSMFNLKLLVSSNVPFAFPSLSPSFVKWVGGAAAESWPPSQP